MTAIQKHTAPTKGYGRGTDNTYTPAAYKVVEDGSVIGYITGSTRRHYGSSTWRVSTADHRLLAVRPTLEKAKAWVLGNLETLKGVYEGDRCPE